MKRGCTLVLLAKWLLRGLYKKKNRAASETDLRSRDLSTSEAGMASTRANSSGPEQLVSGDAAGYAAIVGLNEKLPAILAAGKAWSRAASSGPEQLVSDYMAMYAAIVERQGCLAMVSEELLHGSKQKIKDALLAVARKAQSTGALSSEMGLFLFVGYAGLASFIPQEEADIMERFKSGLEAFGAIKDPRDVGRLQQMAAEMLHYDPSAILQRRKDEMNRLMQEFITVVPF